MKNIYALLQLAVLLALSLAPRAALAEEVPQWIWHEEARDKQEIRFRVEFELSELPLAATFSGSCDNEFSVYVNGARAINDKTWESLAVVPVAASLRKGENAIAVEAKNREGIAGFVGRLTTEADDGTLTTMATSKSWKVASFEPKGWRQAGFDDEGWSDAAELGALGDDKLIWSKKIDANAFENATPTVHQANPKAIAAKNIELLPGFKAELIYTVPKETQGSWVSMTAHPDGSLFVSDQGDAGIYQIKPATLGDPESRTSIERVPVPISNAHGLLWAFDCLYVTVSDGGNSGLYRVTDDNGDGSLNHHERLRPFGGGGEHGPHSIIPSEDGKNLYFNAGNHTDLTEIVGSRAPTNWGEGLLLPRQWDARGHAREKLAPGGWVCKVTPDGSSWELISNGYRNEFDIGLNTEGEMFTFDADMEWDLGTPWYRPTRICHVVSGSEFGWRSGTGKWPVYYEDSLPPVLDVGPGSPTGVVFGTGAKFPNKYQRAFFALDWTFGTIYAIHLEPDGASYKGVKEEFLSGAPLPVTDAVIGADGAFYFAVGGRGTDSALYRVYYDGEDSTDTSAPAESKKTIEARALRHELESFHGKENPEAVDFAWPYLKSQDRFLRYAARIAIENQPVNEWKDRALAEANPQAAACALIALARQGDSSLQSDLLKSLRRFGSSGLEEGAALGLLRAYALCFIRMGAPNDSDRSDSIAHLDPYLPSESGAINTELVRLLVYLDAPAIVEKGLALLADSTPPVLPDWAELLKRNQGYGGTIQTMLNDHPPTNKINYAFMLRNVRYGWSMPQREAYFTFINDAAKHPGGASFTGFLENIRDEALENCSPDEKNALAPITGQSLVAVPDFEVTPPVGPPREWTLAEAVAVAEKNPLEGRDFENGRNSFHAVGCVSCHRFDGAGGNIGPDLSSVGTKYSLSDLLESMVDPSKVISDQYGSSTVLTLDGEIYQGIVIEDAEGEEDGGGIEVYTSDPEAEPIFVEEDNIESIEPSKLSQMPTGVINPLNEDELLDLLAFLLSRGDAEAEFFKK